MKYRIYIIALFIVVLMPGLICAQQTIPAELNEKERAQFDDLRERGSQALFNLDYEGARRDFNEIVRLFPDHPAGPLFLASGLMAKTLNESRRLQSGIYNSDSFYAKADHKSSDKVDPQVVEQFRARTKSAKQLAEARLKLNPRDTEALYFLGATEGLKAAFSATVERSFMGALKDGSNAVEHHRQVLKLDPSFHDAELTIGLYEYVMGSLPLPVKLLASLTGAHGSKKRGLLTLERVVHEGHWASDNARSLLIVLYKREKRFGDALAVSRELAAKYPRNYLFRLEAADALTSQAAVDRGANREAEADSAEREALEIYDALLRDYSPLNPASRSLDLIHFRYGDSLLIAGQPEQAAKEFLAAASVAGAESSLATLSHLHAARALDLAGKRNDALAQYRVVLNRPLAYDAQEEARRGLREQYKNEKQRGKGR